jgi:hypothetical protein
VGWREEDGRETGGDRLSGWRWLYIKMALREHRHGEGISSCPDVGFILSIDISDKCIYSDLEGLWPPIPASPTRRVPRTVG